MKKILGFLVLVGMAAAVAPGFVGRFTEKEYRRALEQLSIHPLISMSTVSYEREWFRSRAVTAMELKIPVPDYDEVDADDYFSEPLRIELVHDLAHGPLIFGGEPGLRPALLTTTTRLRLPAESMDLLTGVYGDKEPLTIESVRPFFGEHHVRLAMAGMSYTDAASGISITLEPATGYWLVAGDLASCRGTLSWPGLTGGSAQGEIKISDVNYVFDMHKLNRHVWTGTSSFDLEHLGIGVPEGFDFTLSALRVDSDLREQEGLLHGRGKLSLAKMVINDAEYGPANYSVQLRRLDAAAVSEIYARQYAMYARMQGADPGEIAAIHEQLGQDLLALLPRLLKKGPEIEVADLTITVPAGEITGAAKIRIDKSQPELLEQLATVPYALHADFRLGLPRALLVNSQAEPQLNVWLATGLLEERDEVISLHGRFAHGQLTLNGNRLPLPVPGSH